MATIDIMMPAAPTQPPPDLTRIRPSRGWRAIDLREVWQYRELLWFLTLRDIKLRYKQTALGVAWAVMQPLFTMAVFTVFFGKLGKLPSDGKPYALFVLAALLPWQLFAYALTQSSNSLVAEQRLITKVYFPRLIVPVASVLSGLVDFLVALWLDGRDDGRRAGVRLVHRQADGRGPGYPGLHPVRGAGGPGRRAVAVGLERPVPRRPLHDPVPDPVLDVPDAGRLPASLVPPAYRLLYGLNPMAGVVEGFRWALLDTDAPDWGMMAVSAGVVAGLVGRRPVLLPADGTNLCRRGVMTHERTGGSGRRTGQRVPAGWAAGAVRHPAGPGQQAGIRSLQGALRGRGERSEQDPPFWALKDVSFEVKRGEVVGIIGRNGAGKSTLLKILSRITEPTEGEVEIHGRVGSLLEVGTGFHPELTGRENIYLNGAILGMRRAEIARKFDEIVAFAEVEKFIDTPVKHYSSGMYMRLAFAVAAHLEPEILIVDEVLAVGDAEFQKKCLGKMGDVARGGPDGAVRQPQHGGGADPVHAGLLAPSRPVDVRWATRSSPGGVRWRGEGESG